jgi:Kef-type K+ transport system membrane component KefB
MPPPASAESDLLHQLRHLSVEDLLLPLLLQLAVIILAARAFALLFRRLRQPSVVGEIAAGLVLGPSVLGKLAPGLFAAVFHPHVEGLPPELADLLLAKVLTTLAQLGLIFLLFLVGLEFDFGHLRRHGHAALAVALAGIALPFALGVGLGRAAHPHLGEPVEPVGFALFLGTALSITAIPVLGRMMLELGITRTRLATVTISAAAVDDAAGWVLLAAVAAVVRGSSAGAGFDPTRTLLMAGATLGFVLFMAFAARPVLCAAARRTLRGAGGELSVSALAALLAVLFGCALVTNLIGVFAVFGAFLLGAVLSGEHAFREAVNSRLRDFVNAFFVPLFFAYTGLRTDVGTLGSWQLWLLCGVVSAAAVAGKLGGCALAARLSGYPARESACIGVLMNTRALMALVVINLGKEMGVLPDSVFCMLILMALLTTVMTTPLLLRWMRGTELEPYVLASGFLGPPPPGARDSGDALIARRPSAAGPSPSGSEGRRQG